MLGINKRNVDFVKCLNKREHFRLVDDKPATKKILIDAGLPTPRLLAKAQSFFEIETFIRQLCSIEGFAIKPARGFGGKGIAVVQSVSGDTWHLTGGEKWSRSQCIEHIGNILYGVFSIDNTMDVAFAEALIKPHPDILQLATAGIPDIRIIIHKGMPVLGMMRIATKKSRGKANLHAGGFAVGIDLQRGITTRGWSGKEPIKKHPETGVWLEGIQIPRWSEIMAAAGRLYTHFPLGYMGADFVVDAGQGPLILELNARPGLEIQNVTATGLLEVLG